MRKQIWVAIAVASAALGGAFLAAAPDATAHDRGDRDGRYERGHHRFMHGAGANRMTDRLIERFDANKDGRLEQAEIDAARRGQFERFDANKDGTLSLDEFQNLWLEQVRERMVRQFQRLDRDGNAGVTLEEAGRRTSRLVERLDRNGDGVIDREDMRRPRQDGRGGRGAAPDQTTPPRAQ